jgi:molecular chaperone GrpE
MTNTEPIESELELAVDIEAPVDEVLPSAEAVTVTEPEVTADARLAELESRLTETEKRAAENLDNFQRSQAAFANFRKRTEAEQMTMRKVANAALLTRLLPVADDFRRAFQVLPAELQGSPWVEGIALIQRKVAAILEVEDVKVIAVKPGDSFDPLFHQAILHQELAGYTEGQIITEVEQGYILGERVLRPSMVIVAKAPTPPAEPVTAPAESEVAAEVQKPTKPEEAPASEDQNG